MKTLQTTETLTTKTLGEIQPPAEGFVELVNSITEITNTEFRDWNFVGHEGSQALSDGYFFGLYKKGDGFAFRLDLATGLFIIDACQIFSTDANGLLWWFFNKYPRSTGKIATVNPELICSAAKLPRKHDGLNAASRAAIASLSQLASCASS